MPANTPHRPWFKVAINTALRFVQTRRRPARLYVLASIFQDGRCVGYAFRWVWHDYLDLGSTSSTPYRPGLDRLANACARRRGARLECATTWWPKGTGEVMTFFTANTFNSVLL